MKSITLGENIAATGVAAQTAVSFITASTTTAAGATPFLPGRDVIARLVNNAVTGTPTVKIQGSDDNSTWVDLLTNTTLGDKQANVILRPYMRLNVTVAGGAGTVAAYLENGA